MPKILYVSNTANFSKFNRPFMHWCTDNGWQVDYCAPGDENIIDCNKHYVVPIPRSPFSRGIFSCIKQLKIILEKEQYDIIHCHTPMGGVIARLAAKKLYRQKKVKIIYTAHGFHFYKGAPLLNWLLYYPVEKYLLKLTDVLITINKEDYERSIEKFSKRCKVLFMNGVGVNLSRFSKVTKKDNSSIRKELGYSDDDFIITVVAETNKNKNQSFLIRQVPVLMEKIPHLKILFLGKETLPDAHNLVNEMGLQDVCQFLGYRKDVELFTKISNICFSASIREGLPVNIIEAMACGKVCICSTNRGHNSLIQNNFNGLIFNLDDPSEMVDEILKVYADKNLAKQLADNSYNESKKYDVKDSVEFTARVYNELISINN